jgi:ABC-type transport system involved in multi-copper enzyme maturation permease subunit
MNATLTIAHLTWLEARRRKIALAVSLCGGLFLLVFGVAAFFAVQRNGGPAAVLARRAQVEFLTLAGLYVVNFLTAAMAVLLAVDTLSGEIHSGVMQTLAAKPIGRVHILLGKWLTFCLITAGYLVLMSGGVVLIVKCLTGFLQPHMERAFALMWLEGIVLVTVSIAGGTRFTTVTNGIVAFAFYGIAFIGGWIEQIGTFLGNESARYIGTAVSLAAPTDALWRLAAAQLLPPVMNQLQITPFSSVSVPSFAMVVWAFSFVAVLLAIAIRSFERREL